MIPCSIKSCSRKLFFKLPCYFSPLFTPSSFAFLLMLLSASSLGKSKRLSVYAKRLGESVLMAETALCLIVLICVIESGATHCSLVVVYRSTTSRLGAQSLVHSDVSSCQSADRRRRRDDDLVFIEMHRLILLHSHASTSRRHQSPNWTPLKEDWVEKRGESFEKREKIGFPGSCLV